MPALTDRVLKLLKNNADVFDPLLHNTVNVVTISGGEQLMGIPSKIEITLVAVLLPGYNMDDIISELKRIISELEFEILRDESLPYKLDMGLFDTLKEILHKADATELLFQYCLQAQQIQERLINWEFKLMVLHQ